MKTNDHAAYADESAARLAAAGLTEDVIIDCERIANDKAAIKQAAIEACGRSPVGAAWLDASPPRLPKSEIKERAVVDGFVDAAMGKPMLMGLRFVEQGLHEHNAESLRFYMMAYEESYRGKAGAK